MDDQLQKYENEGVGKKELDDMFDNFEDEMELSPYKLDFNDEETKTEIRRCLCEDVGFLSTVGPLNPQNLQYDNDTPCKCTPGGICGMYFCMCYENDEKDTWFTGICSFCEESIESIADARRIPLYSGGFLGCFCKNPHCLHCVYSENETAVEHKLIEIMNYMSRVIDVYRKENNIVIVDDDTIFEDDEEEESGFAQIERRKLSKMSKFK
jgi:hypothetical protein